MPIQTGHDTAKTRKTLTVGDKSYDYYSIAASEAAGLGDFSKLPAALTASYTHLTLPTNEND